MIRTTIFAAFASSIIVPVVQAQCVGDIAVDGRVDGGDLAVLLANWGSCTSGALSIASDLNGDGLVDGADLGMLLAVWGACSVVPWAIVIDDHPDPAVVTDQVLRAAIAATGLPWRIRDRGTGIEMVLIPPGTFQMGCIMGSGQYDCHSWEQPVHTVTLANAFYMGRYELTQAQWLATMGSNPSYFNGLPDSASRPVERVSWVSIQGYLAATGMRLPTEAEWEFSCRAGTQTPFYNGTADDATVGVLAWYFANTFANTKPVGGKLPNGLGLYDMLGNVWEWVNDWYGQYAADPQANPLGPASGSGRVVRGGSVDNSTANVRCSDRYGPVPDYTWYSVGFRVARNP